MDPLLASSPSLHMYAERSIVFADVAGSTRIIEAVGEADGLAFIASLLRHIERVTRKLQGEVVRTDGDEIMCSFRSPLDGVVGAIEMQRVIDQHEPASGIRPRIRVGLNWGPVVAEEGEIVGDAVNLAARLASMADAGQILTTGDTIDSMGTSVIPHRALGRFDIRGRDSAIRINEVLWRDDAQEVAERAPRIEQHRAVVFNLRVRNGADAITMVGDVASTVGVGRGDGSVFVVRDSAVSRSHADLVVRGGRFYLADHSSNGTFVRQKGQTPTFVHKNEILLHGSGEFRLGRKFEDPDGPVLRYRVTVATD